MLVCSISQRARRAAIAADVAEAAAALDNPGTGNVVFATLVDDPASVGEIVDAYLGEIMIEAASADTILDANIPATYAANIIEAAAAAETASGTVGSTFAVWDPATIANGTLSNGNLTFSNTGGASADQGARVAASKTTGKYYFELTITTLAGGGNTGIGVCTTASTYTAMGNNATTGVEHFTASGNIWSNGSPSGSSLAGRASGDKIGIAIDLDNRMAWFRVAPAGNWNGSGTANPATNTGGVTIPAGAMVPVCTFNVGGSVFLANFGASTFAGAVPSGFTSGWPA
jgi:hypothetical protein